MIVAFGYKSRVGKNTCSNLLELEFLELDPSLKLGLCSFASELKHVCNTMFNWAGLQGEHFYEEHPELKTEILPELGKSPVSIWIEMSEKVAKTFHPAIWTKITLENQKEDDFTIISDLRFPIEVEEIKNNNGIIVKVNRQTYMHNDYKSDQALDDFTAWDYVIENNGTVEDLKEKISELAKKLMVLR